MFRAKDCPKHVELILYINKLLLQLVGSSALLITDCYKITELKTLGNKTKCKWEKQSETNLQNLEDDGRVAF